jgi:protein disulfide-isomerase
MEPTRHPSFLARHWSKVLFGILLLFIGYLWWPFLHNAVLSAIGSPPPEEQIQWRTDFDRALTEAQELDRPLLVYFTADWCQPCQIMRRQAWPDRQAGELANQRFVPVKIDVDLPENEPVNRRYAVISVPTILVTDPKGQVITAGGFQTARELRQFLRDAAR